MVLQTLFIILAAISTILANNINNNNHNNNHNEWDSRTLESYFTRFGSRIDLLVVRLDHLDSRISRFTSTVQTRLDNVENSLTTTKLRMDLWAEELSRIEEQMARKWKTLEAKFDLIVPSIDSKLETKLTLIQRENRRHNDHLSNSFLNLGQRIEISNDKVVASLYENRINASTLNKCNTMVAKLIGNNSTTTTITDSVLSNQTKLLSLLEDFGNKSAEVLKSGSTLTLVSGKMSNMFDDLIRRSDLIQTGIKDVLNTANLTRHDVQDSLRLSQLKMRAAAATTGSVDGGNNGQLSSSESLSAAVIVEALASVESMSTVLGRRMVELGKSIDERFEMVSMTLNGFLESCVRIQDGAPLIEEHIAAILEKLLDSFDNNTKASQEELFHIREKLESLVLNGTCTSPSLEEFYNTLINAGQYLEQESSTTSMSSVGGTNVPYSHGSTSLSSSSSSSYTTDSSSSRPIDMYETRTAEILKNSPDLTEDEKKSLWESLFPNENNDRSETISSNNNNNNNQNNNNNNIQNYNNDDHNNINNNNYNNNDNDNS